MTINTYVENVHLNLIFILKVNKLVFCGNLCNVCLLFCYFFMKPVKQYLLRKKDSLVLETSSSLHQRSLKLLVSGLAFFFKFETIFSKLFFNCYIYVVVDFLSQVIFVFLLFLGIIMYANEVETKEK